MDLVRLETVKLRLTADGTTMGSEQDTFLQRLVTHYSRVISRKIAGVTGLQLVERTEQYDLFRATRRIKLRAWPVDLSDLDGAKPFKVWIDGSRIFSDGDLLDADPDGDYYIDARLGFVEFDEHYLFSEMGPGIVKVQYTAGFAADAEAMENSADYSDIADACADQVVAHWRRRGNLAANSVNAGGGGQNFSGGLALLDVVKGVIKDHKRNHNG